MDYLPADSFVENLKSDWNLVRSVMPFQIPIL